MQENPTPAIYEVVMNLKTLKNVLSTIMKN